MSNRCPDCSKFVSLEVQEPEVEADIDGDTVTGTVRLVLACAECGTEMKEANLNFEIVTGHECNETPEASGVIKVAEEGQMFEVEDTQAEAMDRYQDTGRHGKPLKSFYQKHFYGADVTVTVKCEGCGETFTLTDTVEEQASGFDELN